MSGLIAARVAAFLLRHEVLVGWAAVLAGALLMGGVLAHKADAPALAHAKSQARASAAQAQAADARAQVQAQTAAAIDAARDREARITHISETRADVLDHETSTPDAPAASIAPDVLRDWAGGVDGLRDEAARARPADRADASAELDPARALPSPR